MMVEMGFFVLTGERYQMVIPPRLNMDRVKMAALKLAETEDEEYFQNTSLPACHIGRQKNGKRACVKWMRTIDVPIGTHC
jgi:hypothetical protein